MIKALIHILNSSLYQVISYLGRRYRERGVLGRKDTNNWAKGFGGFDVCGFNFDKHNLWMNSRFGLTEKQIRD